MQQRGVTLIELMIALTIGLFMLMGVVTVRWGGSVTMPKRAVRKLPINVAHAGK